MQEKHENCLNASIQALIYDCDHPKELARFYAKFLGGVLEADLYGAYVVKVPELGIEFGFQEDEDYTRPTWPGTKNDQPQMLHIDIHVADKNKAMECALSIGATMPKEQFCQSDWDVQWVTMLDPAGHPFCLWDE